MNAMTKAMKERIRIQKRTVVKSATPILDATRTITIALSPTSIAKVLAQRGVDSGEVKNQIKELMDTNTKFRQGEKIPLSQVCECNFDLLFNRQVINKAEGREDFLETYFTAI